MGKEKERLLAQGLKVLKSITGRVEIGLQGDQKKAKRAKVDIALYKKMYRKNPGMLDILNALELKLEGKDFSQSIRDVKKKLKFAGPLKEEFEALIVRIERKIARKRTPEPLKKIPKPQVQPVERVVQKNEPVKPVEKKPQQMETNEEYRKTIVSVTECFEALREGKRRMDADSIKKNMSLIKRLADRKFSMPGIASICRLIYVYGNGEVNKQVLILTRLGLANVTIEEKPLLEKIVEEIEKESC